MLFNDKQPLELLGCGYNYSAKDFIMTITKLIKHTGATADAYGAY